MPSVHHASQLDLATQEQCLADALDRARRALSVRAGSKNANRARWASTAVDLLFFVFCVQQAGTAPALLGLRYALVPVRRVVTVRKVPRRRIARGIVTQADTMMKPEEPYQAVAHCCVQLGGLVAKGPLVELVTTKSTKHKGARGPVPLAHMASTVWSWRRKLDTRQRE
jgi:hypothetical protein